MAGSTGSTNLADYRQHRVLGGNARRQLAVDTHQHIFHLLLDQALGCQHVLNLGSADSLGQGTERPVGGGMGIPTDHSHAR